MTRENPFHIGDGKYTVYYKVHDTDTVRKFTGICENFNTGSSTSAFWNEEKCQMLLVSYRDIVGLYPFN